MNKVKHILKSIIALPFIFIVLIVTFLLDICLFVFQNTAIRAYKVPFTNRKEYLSFKNKKIKKLNFIEKIKYLFSFYINGVFGYSVEMIGRVEKYWCPIKHAKRKAGIHNWEKYFADYGDEEGFKKNFLYFGGIQKITKL